MASRKDDPFEPKLSPPRSRGPGGSRFISKVLKATSQAGHVGRGGVATTRRIKGAIRGRGYVAARMAGRGLAASARRVTIKTRLVNLRKVGSKSSAMHLKYLEREGVTPTGEPGHAYGALTDEADPEEFLERGREDRHQFRFIV